MLLLIHGKSFEFSTWLTREMLIWLENSTQGISNSEDFHYLHWRLVADYPGHVTTHFRTQCQRPVHLKDLICDISHSMKIKYPYTKPQSPTLFISKSHHSHFCTKLWSKTQKLYSCLKIEVFLALQWRSSAPKSGGGTNFFPEKGEGVYNLMHLLLNYNVLGYLQSVFKFY